MTGGSATADRLVPLLRPDELTAALSGRAIVVDGGRAGLVGPLRVRVVSAGPPGSRSSVIVAVQVGDVLASRTVLRTALLISFPLLLVVLAAIASTVIGSTLRPVETLRLGAERIGAGDMAPYRAAGPADPERLPVPAAADEIRSAGP